MRYYIISGEASGDLHGSKLIQEIIKKDSTAEIRCWGGDKMEAAGAVLVKHYRDLAFMGFVEVLKHLPTILKNISFCKKDIQTFQPDVLILIDYPGFNLRIAKWAKNLGLKVVYYISPQVWAWKESRVKLIKKVVDKMLVVLPFEVDFYRRWRYDVQYVGHPLVSVVEDELKKPLIPLSDKPIIALLPGSREQEIQLKLPIMLSVVERFPEYQFIVAQAPGLPDSFYHELLKNTHAFITSEGSYNLLRQSVAALVTSGTATLETALFSVPQVVCYKGNALSYHIAKRLIKVKFISLVNLIADKELVKELIQNNLSTERVKTELAHILKPEVSQHMKKEYQKLYNLLGTQNAAEMAAAAIVNEL